MKAAVDLSPSTTLSRRSWFRFSLRTLLAAITFSGAGLGWFTWQWRRYQGEITACISLKEDFLARWCVDHGIEAGGESELPRLTAEQWRHGRIYLPIIEAGLYEVPNDRPSLHAVEQFPYLEGLWIRHCQPLTRGFSYDRLPSLKELNLQLGSLSDEDLSAIGQLRNLRTLTLSNKERENPASPNASTAWADAISSIHELQHLELRHVSISRKALQGIAQMRQLRSLKLTECRIVADEVDALRSLEYLEEVELANVPVSSKVLQGWARSPKLKRVILDYCSIVDRDLIVISKMRSLEYLSLNGSHVTDGGLKPLQDLPTLYKLRLRDTQLTAAAAEILSHMSSMPITSVDMPEQLRHFVEVLPDRNLRTVVPMEPTAD
ncbi:leucine-rich repeat domain-containing protein [Anatilimnocola sp. NA78]|uniref:leucine-rich repeat domain-containing protein n=1 Tax=Anatilimnocola sp. NA78 TaxID=3415683 RepID=UPI003CE487ED